MKFLIAGLGNIGTRYHNTRHNIGFSILDALTSASNIVFVDHRYAFKTTYSFKGKTFVLIKPTTYMNLSGKAVNYWLQKEKIPIENLLVLVDDLALPFGTMRIRPKGGDGGHNGLKDIQETIGTAEYARLRFGIGAEFSTGKQVDYVLDSWTPEERKALPALLKTAVSIVQSFGTIGLQRTMNLFNTSNEK